MKRRFLLFFIIIALLISMCSPVFATSEKSTEKETLRVGYTDHGMMIQKEEDQFQGYGVEYLKLLAEFTGWEYEFVPVTEANRDEKLLDGTIDLLCDFTEDKRDSEEFLFSSSRSGLYFGLLCAKDSDASVFFNETKLMDGKKIAVNRNHNMQTLLDEFAKKNQISYTPVYCDSFEELEEALSSGKADLMFASNQRALTGYRIVAKVGACNQYFAMASTNEKWMEQLNAADRQLKLRQPFIESVLYEKYYGRPYETLTGLTREEYELISGLEIIRVVCDANSYPIEYVDEQTGEYSGIYADALKLIAQETGLKFEFIPLQQYSKAWEMLGKGDVDMAAGMYVDDTLAEQYNLTYSQSYLSVNYTMIGRNNQTVDSFQKIAIPKNYVGILSYVANNHPEWDVVKAMDASECLKLVADGKADCTIINSIFLQTRYNINNYSGLTVLPMHSIEIPIRCTFAGEKAELLSEIINKAIRRIPEESFNNCIVENTINVSYKPGFRELFKEAMPMMITLVIFVIIIFYIILSMRERYYRHIAMTDSVTGLWNGMCFREKAKDELSRNRSKEYLLISMDMEHFKYVNNDFGDTVADTVLVTIAARLRQIFGNDALYAREMGDRFLLLTKKIDNIEEIQERLSEAILLDINGVKQLYKPILKFGICALQMNKKDIEIGKYIDNAVLARKTIKRDHRRHIVYYDDNMEAEAKAEAQIEKKMEQALKNGEFTVFYQPKYLLKTDEIIGAEALVRWNDPEEGLISPGIFIPIFERNGFVIQLDFFVYEQTIQLLAKRLQEGKKVVPISVNVSRIHIATGDFLQKLIGLTKKYNLPREYVELELTETVLGGKRQNTIEFIKSCKDAGFSISIDDFGSGYSSLNLLKEMPVDVLKIDREFLNELDTSPKSSIIIEQVVEMAKKIDIKTLCEGVETPKQAEFLKQIGCNMVQGYLYSKPVPQNNFEELLEGAR